MWAILPKVTHGQKNVRQPARMNDRSQLAHQREFCLGQPSSSSATLRRIINVGLKLGGDGLTAADVVEAVAEAGGPRAGRRRVPLHAKGGVVGHGELRSPSAAEW